MELWLVRDVPAWLVCLVLVAGLPGLTLVLDVVIHRRFSHSRLSRHNEVTGVMVATVGVAYAIVIGLCVVSLWDGYKDAQDTVRREAVALTPLVSSSAVFDTGVQDSIRTAIVTYDRDIVEDWQTHISTRVDPKRKVDLARITSIITSLDPKTEAQRAFVKHAVEVVGAAEQMRQEAKSEGEDKQMSPVMWMGVLVATVAILALCLFFGIDDTFLRRILLGLAAAVIATNLYLVVEMNFPYYGAFSVSTDAYEAVVRDLS